MSPSTSCTIAILKDKFDFLKRHFDAIENGDPTYCDEPDAPWSKNMGGPYTYAVYNTDSGVVSEFPDPRIASKLAGGTLPLDAGENIKLYVNDMATRKRFSNWGVNSNTIDAFISTGMTAEYRFVASKLQYFLATTDESGNEDTIFEEESEQRFGILQEYRELYESEERNFRPRSSSPEDGATIIDKYLRGEYGPKVDLVRSWLAIFEENRKKGLVPEGLNPQQLANLGEMESLLSGYTMVIEPESAEIDAKENTPTAKSLAAKRRKNQKKYAKKKAGNQNCFSTADVQDHSDLSFGRLDNSQSVARTYLHRKFMGENPSFMDFADMEERGSPEEEDAKDPEEPGSPEREDAEDVSKGNGAQEPHGDEAGDAALPTSWDDLSSAFHGLMAQCGIQDTITFIGDKLGYTNT